MFWYEVAVLIISAYLSYALRPKPQTPAPEQGELPDVKDGKRVRRIFGTVWIDDPTQLAMKQTGQDPIKS